MAIRSGILVAAGRGTRMGGGMDKVFIELANRPILIHSWLRLDRCGLIDEMVVVTREEHFPIVRKLAQAHGLQTPFQLVQGGEERQDSVWNGLNAVSAEAELVAIHDGARPASSLEMIRQVIDEAETHGAAVASARITDTVKEVDGSGFIRTNVDRECIRTVQTPQVFRVTVIREAIRKARELGLRMTDDTAACELIGQRVKLVEHPAPNPKATTPEDLAFIEMLLNRER